jgi:hypothetical protein
MPSPEMVEIILKEIVDIWEVFTMFHVVFHTVNMSLKSCLQETKSNVDVRIFVQS